MKTIKTVNMSENLLSSRNYKKLLNKEEWRYFNTTHKIITPFCRFKDEMEASIAPRDPHSLSRQTM